MNGAAPRLAPRRFSRGRLLAFQGMETLAAALGGRAFYRATSLSRGRLQLREERVVVPGLAAELEGLLILQISDLHAGPFLGAGDLAHAVELANGFAPDLIVCTGDLITRRAEEAYTILAELAHMRARLGKYAVFGNHDYRGRREDQIAARFAAEAGFVFLRDRAVRFGSGPGAVALVGLEDLEEARTPDARRARVDVLPGDVEVVLCHNPAGAPLVVNAQTALVLCGHTHGRQINVPLVRRLAPPHPGDRLQIGGAVVIVNRGLGALGLPLRVGARAELVGVRLSARAEGPR